MAFMLMEDVVEEEVRWLWQGRIPFGKITLLDGDPGLGKSTILLDLAARLSRGERLPGGDQHPPMGTFLLMAEDGAADTIKPRLTNAGADMRLIGHLPTLTDLEGNEVLPEIPLNLPEVENLLARCDARLVVVDPLLTYLGRGDDAHRAQDVMRALTPLAAFAERTGCAVVCLRHLTKAGAGTEVKYRGQGSIGFIGVARSALFVAKDPDDPGRCIIASSKSNLGPPPPSLAYRLVNMPNKASKVAWEGVVERTAQDLADAPAQHKHSVLDGAVDFLRDLLADGEPHRSKEIWREAAEAGHTRLTVRRAGEVLGVKVDKERVQNGGWLWSLPGRQEPAPAKNHHPGYVPKSSDSRDPTDSTDSSNNNKKNLKSLKKTKNLNFSDATAGDDSSPTVAGRVPVALRSGWAACVHCATAFMAVEGQPVLCRRCLGLAGATPVGPEEGA